MKVPCPHYSSCHGCKVMQFPYVKQLRDKELALRKILSGVPILDPVRSWRPIVPSPDQLGYRTSTKLVLGENDFGQRRVGLFERASKKVVDIPGCPVHHPEINKILDNIWGPKAIPPPAPFYKHERRSFQKGRCKYLTVRYCPASRSAAVILSHTGIPTEDLKNWSQNLMLRHVSMYEGTLGPSDENAVLPRQVRHLLGPKTLTLHVGPRSYQLGPLTFFQANWGLTELFVDTIVEELKGEELLDLYGGFGAYSFPLAEQFGSVRLVDTNPDAISAANAFIQGNRVANVTAVLRAVEDELLKPRSEKRRVSDIIVNPPRAGLSFKVKKLLKDRFSDLNTMTYVSCNPLTLARDLKDLVSSLPLQVLSISPFDMFPQTAHLETVVRLGRIRP